MGIGALSSSSPSSPPSSRSQTRAHRDSTRFSAHSSSSSAAPRGRTARENPLAQAVDRIKKALESGQLGTQDATSALQQILQQATGAQTDASQGVQGASGAQPGYSPQDQFQQQPAAQDPSQQVNGHQGHHHRHRAAVKAAAEALGMQPQELRKELQGGKSIADVAKERGIDPQQVEQAVKAQLQKRMGDASDEQLTAVADRIISHQRATPVDPNAETLPATLFTNQSIPA